MTKAEAIACGCAAPAKGTRKAVAVDPEIKTSNLKRLRRIEGQIRGLHRMVDEEYYCADILVQDLIRAGSASRRGQGVDAQSSATLRSPGDQQGKPSGCCRYVRRTSRPDVPTRAVIPYDNSK